MIRPRRLRFLCGLAIALVLMGGCAGRRRAAAGVDSKALTVGIYRGRLEPSDGRTRRFRVLLVAELPDRLHAEVVPPMGPIALILDAGGGNLAVTLPREGVAYVGAAGAGSLGPVLGVPVGPPELVRALLLGESGNDDRYRLERSGPILALPETFAIRTEDATLHLELRRLDRPRDLSPDLGTGRPLPGKEVRTLEDLAREAGRDSVLGGLEAP